MHLDQYLKETGQSQDEFGKRLRKPVSQGLVSQWLRGVTRITLEQALDIKRITKNKVSPQDCADMFHGATSRTDMPAPMPEAAHPLRRKSDHQETNP